MKQRTIRLVIVLGMISLTGIIVTQIFWVSRAFDLRERQFNLNVNIALKNVVDALCEHNGIDAPANNRVEQLSTNYYTVMVNNMIDPDVLEYFLKAEFEKRSLLLDFEYGIYDCSDERMVYGNFVNMNAIDEGQVLQPADFPRLSKDDYYFGVYFPGKSAGIISQMGIWTFSTSVLLLVLIFFGYTMFVILKQKRLSEIQKDFINNMTHEFKTPISTIAISTEVLKGPNIQRQPERLRNYVSIIETENLRLRKQVERVLQMATLEKDRVNLKMEEVDVHEIIREVVKSMEVSLKEKCGEISCDLRAVQFHLKADKLHLTNIVYNLIDNSIKYCVENPLIEMSTRNLKKGIAITIADNGIGIDTDDQKRVFKKFYRVPTGNLHDVKGFGLGLSYVKTMLDAHGGEIKLKSELGKGSEFTIYLPIES